METVVYLTLLLSFSSLYFLLYWVYITIQKWGKFNEEEHCTDKKVSIIIPAYNEQEFIANAINSCIELDYPKEHYEIIVVNDGSTDNTDKICRKYEKKGLIRYFTKQRGGKASALNYGIKNSENEFICSLDADSIFSKNALKCLTSQFNDEQVAAVTPAMKVLNPKNFLQKMQEVEYVVSLFMSKLSSFFNSIYVTPGPGSMYRKKTLLEVGGYNEDCITEDMEIAFKLQKEKYRIKTSLEACVYTCTPESFSGLLKQRTRWNSGFLETLFMHRDILKQKRNLTRFVIPYNIYYLSISFIFAYLVILTPLVAVLKEFLKYQAVSFDVKVVVPTINKILEGFLFSLNYGSTAILTNALVYCILIMLAQKFTGEKLLGRKNIAYSFAFVFFYPVLFAVFGISAVVYFIRYMVSKNKFEMW